MQKCHGCGAEKERGTKEPYPVKDAFFDRGEMVDALFDLKCEPRDEGWLWRTATVCQQCFHRIDPDMWISQQCWERLEPVTPFEGLPCRPMPETEACQPR